jgi:hypothetical protein
LRRFSFCFIFWVSVIVAVFSRVVFQILAVVVAFFRFACPYCSFVFVFVPVLDCRFIIAVVAAVAVAIILIIIVVVAAVVIIIIIVASH